MKSSAASESWKGLCRSRGGTGAPTLCWAGLRPCSSGGRREGERGLGVAGGLSSLNRTAADWVGLTVAGAPAQRLAWR